MEYKSFNCGPYNLHTIKTDRFKTVHMEVHFRNEVNKESLQKRKILSDILTNCSKNYQSYRELLMKLEDLYKPYIYGLTVKNGDVLDTMIVSDFISPNYIDNPKYYNETLDFIFELIMNPFVVNDEFDLKNYNICKRSLEADIQSIDDFPIKKSIRNALEFAYPMNPVSYSLLGTLEALNELTPTELYNEYKYMLDHDLCDIFIIGNIDAEETERIIKKDFALKSIKNRQMKYYLANDKIGKVKTKSDDSSFTQSSLEILYDIESLSDFDRDVVFFIYNYILGSGGITSKLYQSIREKNSLCYAIRSMYLKYNSILMVQVSLDEENVDKAIKLTKKCIKEMAMGDFSEETLVDAKQNIINTLKMSYDDQVSILNNYVFEVFTELPSVDKRIKMFNDVSKKDIVRVANKVRLNTIYNLRGGQK